MKNFEFKSQICTTREQSERLLALGLKKETADFGHCSYGGTYIVPKYPNVHNWDNDIPAWSLHRLVEMLYADIGECMIFFPNTYEEIISDIETLIHRGIFNKDYLEEKRKRNHDCKRDYTLHEVWSIDEHS